MTTNQFALVFAAGMLGGCLIVPSTKSTSRSLGQEQAPARQGATIATMLSTAATGGSIVVTATQRKQCETDTVAITEVTTTRRLRSGGASDPRGRALGVLIAPVTLPVSFLISGLVVGVSGSRTERKTQVVSTDRFICTTVAPNVPVRLLLPSGATVDGTTDASGKLALALPPGEPYRGTVVASAPNVTPAEASYALPTPPLRAVRDTVMACATKHGATGSITVKLTIDPRGAIESAAYDHAPAELAACIGSDLASVRFGERYFSQTLQLPFVLPSA